MATHGRNQNLTAEYKGKILNPKLDYQPLFGKMSPQSSSSGRIKDRTRETAEIEPRKIPDRWMIKTMTVASKRFVSCCVGDCGVFCSLVPRSVGAIRVTRGGLEPSPIARIFPTSLTGDVTSKITEEDWERGWVFCSPLTAEINFESHYSLIAFIPWDSWRTPR